MMALCEYNLYIDSECYFKINYLFVTFNSNFSHETRSYHEFVTMNIPAILQCICYSTSFSNKCEIYVKVLYQINLYLY